MNKSLKSFSYKHKSKLRAYSKRLRDLYLDLSRDIGVDIMPVEIYDVLENVIDQCEDVVFANVPGAGGYDAYYFVVERPT